VRRQLIFDLNLPAAFSRENFIVTESNLEAYGWLNQWPDWPHHCLTIYGDEGCGKSHMGHIWIEEVKGASFTAHEFDKVDFLEDGMNILIDHAEKIRNEERLFHLYNRVNQERGSVLLLSNTSPSQWDIKLADLKSRLNSIPSVKVLPPDDQLLEGVLRKLFTDHQLRVPENVLAFLLRHMERSFKAAVQLVNDLDHKALQEKRNITLPFVRQVLSAA